MSKIALSGNASGTGTFTFAAPGTNTDRTLTLPDASGTVATTADIPSVNPFTLGTAVASTSGTAIDFTGIPSWAKRVTVVFNGLSLSGSSNLLLQIGAGSFVTSGYLSSSVYIFSTASIDRRSGFTTGFILYNAGGAAVDAAGCCQFDKLTDNTWVSRHNAYATNGNFFGSGAGVSLSGALDRVRITTVNGTDTFDAGTINISYEG
jgi:hypothetical protein